MKKSLDPRKPRTYKAREEPYYKAIRRAWKLNNHLGNILEDVVEAFAKGEEIYSEGKNGIVTPLTEKQIKPSKERSHR